MKVSQLWAITRITFRDFGNDKVLRLSAALAYYAMFSIGPLLLIAVGVVGLAFGNENARMHLQEQLRAVLGTDSARMVESMMVARPRASLLTTVIGAVVLLVGAAGVFGQLQDSLNTIWKVRVKPGKGLWGFVRARFLSLTMVLGIGFLLLVSLALTTFLSALVGSLGSRLPLPANILHLLDFVVSMGVITLSFALIFKFLPDVKIPLRKVWLGAGITALLFTIGKYLLSLYLGRASTASAYGAAGSVIVVLMWIYYASVILLVGAEFTHVYALETGMRIVPTKYAEVVTEQQRAREGMATEKSLPTVAAPTTRSPGEVLARTPWQIWALLLVAEMARKLLRKQPVK